LILGTEGSEFIVSDRKGIYKTGEQIITSKVSTSVGEVAKTEIKSISFDDESAIAPLSELQRTYPGADIFLSGELAIDFPEDVKIPVEPNQMVTAELVGSSLKLNYCGLERAIAYLEEQYAVGTVEVKIVRS
jgi:inner membrane protein